MENIPPNSISADLREHKSLCHQILSLTEHENVWLQQAGESSPVFSSCETRKNLLPALGKSLDKLKSHRTRWQQMTPEAKGKHPEVESLLRQNQDLIMKIIMLDRENEQGLLRRGMLPSRSLPPVQRQRPHYVADLYRKHVT